MTKNQTKYPKGSGEKRPFRLWNAQDKKSIPWRCYKYEHNAKDGALLEAKWAEVGLTIEMYDRRNGKLLGQYTRKANSLLIQEF
jgi:hypothetical protein